MQYGKNGASSGEVDVTYIACTPVDIPFSISLPPVGNLFVQSCVQFTATQIAERGDRSYRLLPGFEIHVGQIGMVRFDQ